MSRCKGCNVEIAVEWWVPEQGCLPILEDLCLKCRRASGINNYVKPIEAPPTLEDLGDLYADSSIPIGNERDC